MNVILMYAMADMGDGNWLYADSYGQSTFHDYIDLERCIPGNATYIENTGDTFSYINADMCIIAAKSQVTMPNGDIKFFKRWEVRTQDGAGLSASHTWAHRELPVYRNQDNVATYVFTAVYGQSIHMPMPPLPHIDLSKIIKLKQG